MSVSEQKPKLKWHRLVQIIILPITILGACYSLISYFTDLFGLNLSWTDHSLKRLLELGGADVFHLGPYFWPVIIILAITLLILILALYAWIGSFRWRKYSYRCWLAMVTASAAWMFASLWAFWEYGLNRGGIIQWAQYISSVYGEQIRVDSTLFTVMRVMVIVLAILILLYLVANYIYYAKRRTLFRSADDFQAPYDETAVKQPAVSETPAAVKETKPEPVVEAVQPEPEPVYAEPEPVEIKPEPVITEPEPEPVTEPIPVTPAAEEEPLIPEEEPDELAALLEDTEKSFQQIASGKPADAEVVEPAEEPQPEISLQEEEEPLFIDEEPVTRTILPMEDEAEPEPLAETQILDTVPEAPVSEISFCPDCGTRIPDPQMRFCIHCGRKIR